MCCLPGSRRFLGLGLSVSDVTPEESDWLSELTRRFLPALGMSIE
jgi:hypothetical protein